jgi:cytochrome c peroxidase
VPKSPEIVALLLVTAVMGANAQPPLPRDELPRDLFEHQPPLGLPASPRARQSVDRQRFDIGRRLFFDSILSTDRTVSCASCHQPEHGFSAPEALPLGVRGRRASRNAPTLFNRAFGVLNSWDGRATSLEEQALLPIENPQEMDLPMNEALARLAADETYARAFAAAWPDGLTRENLGAALALFMRRIYLGASPIDRFQSGGRDALSLEERGGLWIYESKGRCWQCHSGPNFSDEAFHNTGIGAREGTPEPGRFQVSGRDEDRGRFKTPTLRGLTLTAPYMHDGSLETLEEVVAYYRRGGNPNSHLDPKIAPLDLSDREAKNLVAFLEALSRQSTAKDD